jgi:predicted DNA-binding transcriptional regulator AlpA
MDSEMPDKRSRARGRRKLSYIPQDPLLTATEAAAERGQAPSTFWRDVAAGRVPPAYYVSPRCPRWRRSEVRASVEACRAPVRGNEVDRQPQATNQANDGARCVKRVWVNDAEEPTASTNRSDGAD